MRSESVEIYSDTTNAAVLRHPGKKFPGVLVQGDTLYTMCQAAVAKTKFTRHLQGDSAPAKTTKPTWSRLYVRITC